MTPLEERVLAALAEVYDPCSVAAASPLSIFEMGMVTRIGADAGGAVEIELRPTSPMCTLIAGILEAVERRVSMVPGVSAVRTRIDTSEVWSESALTEEGRRKLEARRTRSRREVPVIPQEWRRRNRAATRTAPTGGC